MDILNMHSPELEDLILLLDQIEDRMSQLVLESAEKEWLSPDEVCKELGISRRTLQRYRDEEGLEYSKIGVKIFYSREKIKSFLNDHSIK